MNKNSLLLIILCVLVSASTSMLVNYNYKSERLAQEKNYCKLIGESELMLSGNLRKYFHAAVPNNFISAANRAKSSVVGINSLVKETESGTDRYAKTTGSGVLVTSEGHIVTNYHVIEKASDIEIVLDDYREFKAKLVGADPSTDLAILKIEATDLTPAVYGNSDSLHIGEWVLAIGNPFKLQTTVTAGIVSAKARDINILQRQGIESFIQTDAAINPGNSGGALVNTNGELVGINTAIMTESGRYEGFSFAIPINLMQKVVYDIITYGAVQRGWMGINIFDVDNDKAKSLNLESVSGIYIDRVDKSGAAFESGIRSGDVITALNGMRTTRIPNFMEQIAKYRPGDKVSIDFLRDGQKMKSTVTLRNQLNTTAFIAVRKDPILTELGFEIRDLDNKEKDILPDNGIYVVSIYKGSIINQTNMEPGYIITSVNGEPIGSADDLVQFLKSTKGDVILEGYYENYVGKFPYTFHIE